MRNIFSIFKSDFKRMTQSIVCLVMVIGMSIVPCMYGWMNVLSTFDPYSEESTSRIKIAIASDDNGTDFYGLEINTGDLVIDALKANNTIGWVFADSSEDAVRGVKSGEYYAAIVVPETFSEELIAFRNGDFRHPQIIFYENDKKNIIASKITDLAKNTVRDQINATFTSTLVKAATSAASAGQGIGIDAYSTYNDILDTLNDLTTDLQYIQAMTLAMDTLADSADSLVGTAQDFLPELDGLISDTSDELDDIYGRLENGQADMDDLNRASILVLDQAISSLNTLDAWLAAETDDANTLILDSQDSIKKLNETMKDLHSFLDDAMDYLKKETPNFMEIGSAYNHAIDMIDSTEKLLGPLIAFHAEDASKKGNISEAQAAQAQGQAAQKTASDLKDDLKDAKKALQNARDDIEGIENVLTRLNNDNIAMLDSIEKDLGSLSKDLILITDNLRSDISDVNGSLTDLVNKLDTEERLDLAVDLAQENIRTIIDTLGHTDGMYSSAMAALSGYSSSLGSIKGDLNGTSSVINSVDSIIQSLLVTMMDFEADGSLDHIVNLSNDNAAELSDFLAEPVKLDTIEVYAIGNYGSASAPFYTLLALWAGALFTMALFKARVAPADRPQGLKSWQEFAGRYLLVFFITQCQALVTGLGIAFYIGIDCAHPWLYVAGCMAASLAFSLINFSLAYAMDTVGVGASVILVLLQVAGSGGSFPIEVLPDIYQKIYPFMPFKPALAMMREAVGGLYGDVYIKSLICLILFGLASIPVGMVLKLVYSPIYRLMAEGKKKTGIMV